MAATVRSLAVGVVGVVVTTIVVRMLTAIVWFGDLLAIGLPVVAVGSMAALAACTAARSSRLVRFPFACLGIAAVVLTYAPRLGTGGDPPIDPVRLAAANVQWDNLRLGPATAALVDVEADVLVVSELTRAADRRLAPAFAYRALSHGSLGDFGHDQGVYSRHPLEVLDVVRGSDVPISTVVVRVDAPHPFVLIGLHLPRPVLGGDAGDGEGVVSFERHRELVGHVLELVDELGAGGLPVVVAGDLNLADRTEGYRMATDRLHDAMVDGVAAPTFGRSLPWRLLGLRIDHVFVTPQWCSEEPATFDVPGSDHRAVEAAVGPCR